MLRQRNPVIRVLLLCIAAFVVVGTALIAGSLGPWTARPLASGPEREASFDEGVLRTGEVSGPPPEPAGESGALDTKLDVPLGLLGALLLATLVAIALISWIRWQGDRRRAQPPTVVRPSVVRAGAAAGSADEPNGVENDFVPGSFDTRAAADAIIAGWLLVEEAAAGAGAPRRPEQTPTEFVESVVQARGQVAAADAAVLLRLYQRARFDHVALDRAAAESARRAVDAIRSALAPT